MAVPWDSRCLVRITWERRVILTRIEWLCVAKKYRDSTVAEGGYRNGYAQYSACFRLDRISSQGADTNIESCAQRRPKESSVKAAVV